MPYDTRNSDQKITHKFKRLQINLNHMDIGHRFQKKNIVSFLHMKQNQIIFRTIFYDSDSDKINWIIIKNWLTAKFIYLVYGVCRAESIWNIWFICYAVLWRHSFIDPSTTTLKFHSLSVHLYWCESSLQKAISLSVLLFLSQSQVIDTLFIFSSFAWFPLNLVFSSVHTN